jgi:hypothetical protein
MFVKTVVLVLMAFVAVFPLYFWLPRKEPHTTRLRKFILTLPNVAGGIVLVIVWLTDIPILLKLLVTLWKISLISVSRRSWKKPYPDARLMTIPCVLGVYTLFCLQKYFVQPAWEAILLGFFIALVGTGFFSVITRKM